MITNKIAKSILLNTRILMRFGGGHHHAPYDWRDDKGQNPDIFEDPRAIGIQPAQTYQFPYKSDVQLKHPYSHPDQYNAKDLTTNMVGAPGFGRIQNNPDASVTDYLNDAAHEFDYQSQDLDFQPESFGYQHFRKQGPIWMWVIVGFTPIWFFANQLFFQYWPDADNWRYQRPPPLNFPDDAETPDTEYHRMFKSEPHKDFYDAGIVNAPFFDIIDGKKVYTKWAGVNQPRQAI